MNLILLIIGILLYVASNLNREYVQPDFCWETFLYKHAIAVFISFMLGVAVILTTDYGIIIEEALEKLGQLTYLVIGYAGQSIFNSLTETIDTNIRTKWGRN